MLLIHNVNDNIVEHECRKTNQKNSDFSIKESYRQILPLIAEDK